MDELKIALLGMAAYSLLSYVFKVEEAVALGLGTILAAIIGIAKGPERRPPLQAVLPWLKQGFKEMGPLRALCVLGGMVVGLVLIVVLPLKGVQEKASEAEIKKLASHRPDVALDPKNGIPYQIRLANELNITLTPAANKSLADAIDISRTIPSLRVQEGVEATISAYRDYTDKASRSASVIQRHLSEAMLLVFKVVGRDNKILSEEDAKRAIALFSKIIDEAGPDQEQYKILALEERAFLRRQLKDFANSLADTDQVLKMAPKIRHQGDLLRARALSLYGLQRWEDTISAATEALREGPYLTEQSEKNYFTLDLLRVRGEAFLRVRQPEKALTDVVDAIKIADSFPDDKKRRAYLMLGTNLVLIHLTLDDLPAAREFVKGWLDHGWNEPVAAQIAALLDQSQTASDAFERVFPVIMTRSPQ